MCASAPAKASLRLLSGLFSEMQQVVCSAGVFYSGPAEFLPNPWIKTLARPFVATLRNLILHSMFDS